MPQPGWTGAGGAADSAWDRVQFGSYVVPGLASVTGLTIGQDVDVKKAKGKDGATLEDNGLEPAKFNVEIQLNEELWPAFQEVLPNIDPRRPGATRTPIEIVHPATALVNVREIVIRKINIGRPTARSGLKVVFECLQWFPAPKPKKTTNKPKDAGRAALQPEDRARVNMVEAAWAAADESNKVGLEMSKNDMENNTFGDPFAPIGT